MKPLDTDITEFSGLSTFYIKVMTLYISKSFSFLLTGDIYERDKAVSSR